ncbi:hypothetical protein MCL92_15420, partial [Providencia rettgeri]
IAISTLGKEQIKILKKDELFSFLASLISIYILFACVNIHIFTLIIHFFTRSNVIMHLRSDSLNLAKDP